MILNEKKTTVAYRCPECGSFVRSMVGVFTLTADMMRLKCPCGGSDMTIVYTRDEKVKITVPCFVCPTPHTFTLSPNAFFGRSLTALPCAYTGLDVCFIGDEQSVSEASENADRELEKLLGELGEGVSFGDISSDRSSQFMTDPQIRDIVTFVLQDLTEEGKIYCRCPEGEAGEYEAEILDEEIVVRCKKCGAAAVVAANSFTAANDFLNVDHLTLE